MPRAYEEKGAYESQMEEKRGLRKSKMRENPGLTLPMILLQLPSLAVTYFVNVHSTYTTYLLIQVRGQFNVGSIDFVFPAYEILITPLNSYDEIGVPLQSA